MNELRFKRLEAELQLLKQKMQQLEVKLEAQQAVSHPTDDSMERVSK